MRPGSVLFRKTPDGVLVAPPTCGLVTVPDLITHIRAGRAGGITGDLVVDLSEVDRIDVAAIRALLWSHRYCTATGRRLTIVPPPPGVLPRPYELLLQSMVVADPAPLGAGLDLASA